MHLRILGVAIGIAIGSLSLSASAVNTPMGGSFYGINNFSNVDVNAPVSPPLPVNELGNPQLVVAAGGGVDGGLNTAAVDVTPTTANGDIRVAAGAFFDSGAKFSGFPLFPVAVQLNSSFTHSNSLTQTFAVGGGPGNLTWCPSFGNPANQTCTDPSQATGGNGRVVYTQGVNQFGGSFNMLRVAAGNYVSTLETIPVLKHNHAISINNQIWPVGYAVTATPSNPLGVVHFTQQQPPGKVTTGGVLYVATTASLHPTQCAQCTGAIKTPGVVTVTAPLPPANLFEGFAMTTGMVTMSDSELSPNNTGSRSAVITTGSDNRTSMGLVGSVNLVSGGVSYANPNQGFERRGVVRMTLPEPGSAAGLATALGGLALLYARRKRSS